MYLSGFDNDATATFEGGAVGRYVINRQGQDARIGTFTAKARLECHIPRRRSHAPGANFRLP